MRLTRGCREVLLSLLWGLLLSTSTGATELASLAPRVVADEKVGSVESIKESSPDLRIEINIPATRLTLFENRMPIKRYAISVGSRKFPTPVMSDEMTTIIWNPWWYPPDSDWAKEEVDTPPGPTNPLGPVKMVLGREIRIHGTLSPASIGRASSHGCFRMLNRDAKELARTIQERLSDQSDERLFRKYARYADRSFYVTLKQSLPVDIIYRPVELVGDTIMIYPDYYRTIKSVATAILSALEEAGIDTRYIDREKLLLVDGRTRTYRKSHFPLMDILLTNLPASANKVAESPNDAMTPLPLSAEVEALFSMN